MLITSCVVGFIGVYMLSIIDVIFVSSKLTISFKFALQQHLRFKDSPLEVDNSISKKKLKAVLQVENIHTAIK